MNKIIYLLLISLFFSCVKMDEKESSSLIKNSQSENIAFIIDLKVNSNTNEDLNLFINEITNTVVENEDFCLEYAYYVSDDKSSVTLYEKYIDSKSAVTHGQNFIKGVFFERFFNLFTLEKFIVTGSATKEFKDFASDNGFVIDYRESVDGFVR